MVKDEDIKTIRFEILGGETCKFGYWISEGLNTRVIVEIYEGPSEIRDYDTYLKKDEDAHEAVIRGFKSFFDTEPEITDVEHSGN